MGIISAGRCIAMRRNFCYNTVDALTRGVDKVAMRSLSLVPSTVTKSLICVNEVNPTEIAGLLYNPFLPEPVSFSAVYDIVDILENFFDKLSFPQATYDYRAFGKPKQSHTAPKKNESEVYRYVSDEIFTTVQGKKKQHS